MVLRYTFYVLADVKSLRDQLVAESGYPGYVWRMFSYGYHRHAWACKDVSCSRSFHFLSVLDWMAQIIFLSFLHLGEVIIIYEVVAWMSHSHRITDLSGTTLFFTQLPTCGPVTSCHQILNHFGAISFSFEWTRCAVCRVPMYRNCILWFKFLVSGLVALGIFYILIRSLS